MSGPGRPRSRTRPDSALPSRPTVIVVPCRDEAERLRPDAFLSYAERDPATGFLFVDDASVDATREVLDRLAAERPDAMAAQSLASHGGKAEAVRRGVLAARGAGPEYVGYWDADLSTPLEAIGELRERLESDSRLDIVLGSRVRLLGRRIRRDPARHYLGRVFATMASLVLGLPVYDTQCGAKLFRVGPYLDDLFGEPFRSRWVFDVELLARFVEGETGPEALPPAERILEHPLQTWEDVAGSRLRARDFLRAPIELLAIYLRYGRVARQRARAHPPPASGENGEIPNG